MIGTIAIICKRQPLIWMLLAVLLTAIDGACLTRRSLALPAVPEQNAAKPTLEPVATPLDLKALEPSQTPPSVVTATTISQYGLTIPSLWWVKDQFAAQEKFAGKLLQNWLAYPDQKRQPGRVDFVVNRQLWSLIDYLQRYAFVHEFGSAARRYGYNIRVFDDRANFLAAYTCDFDATNISELQQAAIAARSTPTGTTPALTHRTDLIPCNIKLDSNSTTGFRGGPNGAIAAPSK